MTLPLTLLPNRPMETPTAAETMFTQLFGVLYITLTGIVDTMVPNSVPWSLLGWSVSYIIKLAPILWWPLPSGLAVFCPEPTNASIYSWLPDSTSETLMGLHENSKVDCSPSQKIHIPLALLDPHHCHRSNEENAPSNAPSADTLGPPWKPDSNHSITSGGSESTKPHASQSKEEFTDDYGSEEDNEDHSKKTTKQPGQGEILGCICGFTSLLSPLYLPLTSLCLTLALVVPLQQSVLMTLFWLTFPLNQNLWIIAL
ncbi:hypothetical protein DSO57_1002834 [Entomophthora muscae]|uniref:Uncharacterized protein n=1 Tax=Entomophthora muscae TaxID=34485 RepID=A0ACC2RZJ9_9FUNG|nr:hypothetical protein DSO57_1002834 [Entomophthora muscae]